MKRIHLIISILVAATRRNDYSFINNNPRPLALNHPSFLRGVLFSSDVMLIDKNL